MFLALRWRNGTSSGGELHARGIWAALSNFDRTTCDFAVTHSAGHPADLAPREQFTLLVGRDGAAIRLTDDVGALGAEYDLDLAFLGDEIFSSHIAIASSDVMDIEHDETPRVTFNNRKFYRTAALRSDAVEDKYATDFSTSRRSRDGLIGNSVRDHDESDDTFISISGPMIDLPSKNIRRRFRIRCEARMLST